MSDKNTKNSTDPRVTGTSRWAINKRRQCLSDQSLEFLLPTCTKIIRSDVSRQSTQSFAVDENNTSSQYAWSEASKAQNDESVICTKQDNCQPASLIDMGDHASCSLLSLCDKSNCFESEDVDESSLTSASNPVPDIIDIDNIEAVFLDSEEDYLVGLDSDEVDSDSELENLQIFAGNESVQSSVVKLLSASFYLKYHLSKQALGDYLQILNISSHSVLNEQLGSPYLLLKRYRQFEQELKRIFPCSVCSARLVNDENGQPKLNQRCGHKFKKEKADGCYTLLLSIEEQLVYFLKHYGIRRQQQTEATNNFIGDVMQSDCYKKLRDDGVIDNATITLQLFVDGAQKFKASSYSFWPFIGIINESGYKIRRSNVILFALWFGNRTPPRSVFLDPCVEELNRLARTGIEFEGKKYTIRPIIVTVDTIARAVIRNTKRFNGEFGCDFCIHPGENIRTKNNGNSRVYCEIHDESNPFYPSYPERTNLQYQNDLKEAIRSGKPFRGVIGPTNLSELDSFDFIRSFIPEYMHSVCLGVVKYFILLWISKQHKKELWYIGDKVDVLNARLVNTRPPYDITRTLHSLDNLPHWKASDFRTFLLYFFPVLQDILPEPFFLHFSKLSYSLNVLLQEQVARKFVEDVGILLRDFVKEAEMLYGSTRITYNIHLLTHLSKSVLDWGCLWTTSAFIPEWFNGQLQSSSNGTQAVVEQMAHSFHMLNQVRNEVIELIKSKPIPQKTRSLFKRLLCLPIIPNMFDKNQSSSFKSNEFSVTYKFIGKSRNLMLMPYQVEAVKSLLLKEEHTLKLYEVEKEKLFNFVRSSVAHFYPKLELVHHTVFTTSSYSRSKKRINYCGLLRGGEFFEIESFLHFPNNSVFPTFESSFVLGRILGNEEKLLFTPAPIGETVFLPLPGQTTRLIGKNSTLLAIRPEQIFRKCVVTTKNTLTETFCLTALPNTQETD